MHILVFGKGGPLAPAEGAGGHNPRSLQIPRSDLTTSQGALRVTKESAGLMTSRVLSGERIMSES